MTPKLRVNTDAQAAGFGPLLVSTMLESSLVMSHLGLTSRCARLFQWDVFRCVEVSTLVPAADPRSR